MPKGNGETFSFADEPSPRPEPAKKEPAQLLLDWLLQHWTNPDICLRDIRAYAPNSIRDEEIAISSAEALVRHGWLTELNAHRRDRRVLAYRPKADNPPNRTSRITVQLCGQLNIPAGRLFLGRQISENPHPEYFPGRISRIFPGNIFEFPTLGLPQQAFGPL
jgi:hypothetical protein